MAEGKWIEGLTPDTPAVDAARVVLAARLGSVRHYLPLAAGQPGAVENVHQLRVATRRAGAALRLFRPLVPAKSYKQVRGTLRAIRAAAGPARDWDVFAKSLETSPGLRKPGTHEAREFLTTYSLGWRAAVQRELDAVAVARLERLETGSDNLLGALKPGDDEPFATVAEEALADLMARLAARLDSDPSTAEELHALRIAGKQLRYAMEVFADCYAAPFRDALYPAVEALQEHLGDVQDAEVAAARLDSVLADLHGFQPASAKLVRPAVAKMKTEVAARGTAGKRGFRTWVKLWKRLLVKHPLTELALPASP